MALISKARGRRENETPSGYERLFGNRKLGMLMSKVQSAVITTGNELEEFLAVRIKKIDGIAIGSINKQNRVFKNAKTDTSGKSHNITIDCVIERDGKILLIEIKDGDTFDNKKVEGEVDSLALAKQYVINTKKVEGSNVKIYYCSFNARNHEQIEKGAKGRLPQGSALTGKELCELLDLDFDKIVEERKKDQKENLKYFVSELKNAEYGS